MQVQGVARDFDTYLLPRGTADIFFPQNFETLSALYGGITTEDSAAHVQTMKSDVFLRQYAHAETTRTADGFNPLLEDFQNTAVLIGSQM